MAWQTPHDPGALPAPYPAREPVLAALAHYDDCRRLRDDARRVCGPDSDEYARAERARRTALMLLDVALGTTAPPAGGRDGG